MGYLIKNKTVKIDICDGLNLLNKIPKKEVKKANARIQRKLNPIFKKIKLTRKMAEIRSSKIIINI